MDLEDKEFKETIRNARRKLETPVAPAMPCKISKNNQNWVTRGKSNECQICSSKTLRWNRMHLLLRGDQRPKQNHKDEISCQPHPQELYPSVRESGLMSSQKIIRISPTRCQNDDWLLFFVMVSFLENKMNRLNSGEYKVVFGTNLRTLSIGLMKCARAQWQEAEATRKDFNIVLIRQDKKFFTSELFKFIQDAIPLILHCSTMFLIPNNFFEYIYQIGCAINLHSIINSGLIPGGEILSKWQTVFILYGCESHE